MASKRKSNAANSSYWSRRLKPRIPKARRQAVAGVLHPQRHKLAIEDSVKNPQAQRIHLMVSTVGNAQRKCELAYVNAGEIGLPLPADWAFSAGRLSESEEVRSVTRAPVVRALIRRRAGSGLAY